MRKFDRQNGRVIIEKGNISNHMVQYLSILLTVGCLAGYSNSLLLLGVMGATRQIMLPWLLQYRMLLVNVVYMLFHRQSDTLRHVSSSNPARLIATVMKFIKFSLIV